MEIYWIGVVFLSAWSARFPVMDSVEERLLTLRTLGTPSLKSTTRNCSARSARCRPASTRGRRSTIATIRCRFRQAQHTYRHS